MRTLLLTVALLFVSAANAQDQRNLTTDQPQATDAKPAGMGAKPADAATAPPEKKKPVAKKRETDEQKARRIAKKYGVTW